MELDCVLAEDEELIGELTSVKYQFTSSGKIQVESKEMMKKRGVPSPNKADAWNLTMADSGHSRTKWAKLEYPDMGYV